MNKKTILKMILLIITIALITCISTSVFAADEDDDALDLSGSITDKEDEADETDKDTTPGNKDTTTENKDTVVDKETTTNKETAGNKDTTVDKNMPQTGLEDSMPIAILFVVCGVVGVYTFIKLSEYSNI